MSNITNIRYRDIAQAEKDERARLKARLDQLGKIGEKSRGLTPDELEEKDRISAVLAVIEGDKSELCERLFVGVRDLFNDTPGLLGGVLNNHVDGILRGPKANEDGLSDEASCKAALTIGLLIIDDALGNAPGVAAKRAAFLKYKAAERRRDADALTAEVAAALAKPGDLSKKEKADVEKKDAEAAALLKRAAALDDEAAAEQKKTAAANGRQAEPALREIVADSSKPQWAPLSRMFFAAIGEAQSMSSLAMLVLPLLAIEGDPRGKANRSPGTVDAREFARVMRELTTDGVTDEEPQLRRRINGVLDRIQNRATDGSSVELGIDLPDLEDAAKSSIVPDNVRLMGPMICAAMFDELKAFEVVDKLVELFQQGMLTIGNGNAGKQLYKYWKDAPNRMSDAERRNFYAMTMGIPGGETGGMVNREFNDLWLRFVSSVSSFVRQNEVDKLLRATLPSPISHQQIRKAARDLAVNLSLHGYGMAYYAALDLQAQIKFMIGLLGDKEVMANYGARDMWQVVDQVATLELGGAKTSSRYRTLATCGAIITAWLADNSERISHATGPIIDIDEVRQPKPRIDGSKATTSPTDADLVNACELWLADTATGDSVIDQMAQPRETPVMTSRPVQIPTLAREMLADLPGMGLSYRNTQH